MTNLNNKKIAIFGSTGHIAKNLVFYFNKQKFGDLVLFSRNKKKLEKIIKSNFKNLNFVSENYSKFNKHHYDVIINCIGEGDPANLITSKHTIIKTTEYFDNKIIKYLKNNPDTKYINFSSGSIYGHNFKLPVTDLTLAIYDANKLNIGNFYTVSKLYSEIKHRNLNDLNIIDLRVFSFFSRFMDLKTKFLMSEIANSIKFNKKFITDKNNITRDYIHPHDLFQIIKACIKKKKINIAFDVSSKRSINKFDLLKSLSKKHGLRYEIRKKKQISPTGIKMNYYSKSKKIKALGITPEYTSLQTILTELKFLLNSNV